MIRFVDHKNIDKEAWDDFISSSPQGQIYAFSWYLDIVSPGWHALIDDNFTSVFPLTWRKKAGIHYLFQPPFTQQLGLYTSAEKIHSDQLTNFIKAIPSEFKLIEIQLNVDNVNQSHTSFKVSNKVTHHLPLQNEISFIRKNYSDNLRRNIKKSTHENLMCSNNCAEEELIHLFRSNRGKGLGTLRTKEYNILKSLCSELRKRNLLELICIKKNKELLAGAIFVKSIHSYIFIFSATSEYGKKTGAMSSIIDYFIERHSGEKMWLDFEGSMDKNLARFYKIFGSKEVVYLQIIRNNLPLLIRWLK